VTRVLLSNLWLFAPLVEAELKKSPSANATFRTTTALTVVNAGQAENVLPGRATALVNFRLLPATAATPVVAHVVRTIADRRSRTSASRRLGGVAHRVDRRPRLSRDRAQPHRAASGCRRRPRDS
jgi:acetylornithine deacetylase/succinyl-diaminopimelate desuccinylase-like protein